MSTTTSARTTRTPVPPAAPGDPAVARLAALTDLVTPYAIRAAATLGVADLIAEGVTTADALAERTRSDADALRRLLDHLAASGLLDEPEPGRYALTDLGSVLRDDHPARTRAWLDLDGGMGRSDLALSGLLTTVRTGEPAYPERFGASFWEDLAADPARAASFDALMETHLANVEAAADAYDWSGVGHVVDVGGGTGKLLARILDAHRDLRGTLVELPGTAENARRRLADAGLTDRCAVVPGTFFDPLPPGADVYVLSFVLHDWNDRRAARILDRCATAAAPHGHVVVIERLKEDGVKQPWATAMDLRMLLTAGGRERTLDDFRALAATAGLTLRTAVQTPTGASVLTFTTDHRGS
ncbi:O-methyltransferase [Streptomyces hygroscopicus subsp. limoneus]|nr:O-methyltransferase [Streptomyces hygroscopicus subsp. limoneus]